MIGYLRGTVSHIFADHCLVDVQGVGYRLFISASTRQKLVLGAIMTLFTYLYVREDAMLLYGFYTQEEYELFLNLTSVSGIGPKVALGILSAITPEGFYIAVGRKDISVLTKIPGIGKKTAERIILELKDKLGAFAAGHDDADVPCDMAITDDASEQALQALAVLGYSQVEVGNIVKRLAKNTSSVEALIKQALKELGRR